MPTDAQHTKAHPKQKSLPSLIKPLLISSIALQAHTPSQFTPLPKNGAGGCGRKQIGRGWLSAPILEQHTIELERIEILLLIANVVVLFVSTSAAWLPHHTARVAAAGPRARAVGGQGDRQPTR